MCRHGVGMASVSETTAKQRIPSVMFLTTVCDETDRRGFQSGTERFLRNQVDFSKTYSELSFASSRCYHPSRKNSRRKACQIVMETALCGSWPAWELGRWWEYCTRRAPETRPVKSFSPRLRKVAIRFVSRLARRANRRKNGWIVAAT